jgi:GcrA cell cycle regulator
MSNLDYTWRNRSWTPERVATLKRLWAYGVTAEGIAAELHANCTAGAVFSKAQKLGLPHRHMDNPSKWTDERIEKLKSLWNAGYSAELVAQELGDGITRDAVIGKVHRLGLQKGGSDPESRRITSKRHAKRQRRAGIRLLGLDAPPVAKRVLPLPLPPSGEPTASAVKFEALETHHCRWIYGEGSERLFCGCDATPGTSWCPSHRNKVFQPPAQQLVRRRHIPERQKTYEEIERENA